MLRDRGNIKWTAMMLPEHVQQLKKWQQETKQIAKPAFDEWTLQALEEELLQAYYCKKEVVLEVWHQQTSMEYRGMITILNHEEKKVRLYNTKQNIERWVGVECILHIKTLE